MGQPVVSDKARNRFATGHWGTHTAHWALAAGQFRPTFSPLEGVWLLKLKRSSSTGVSLRADLGRRDTVRRSAARASTWHTQFTCVLLCCAILLGPPCKLALMERRLNAMLNTYDEPAPQSHAATCNFSATLM